jgi:predicted DNA-binding mobile mystery protein A
MSRTDRVQARRALDRRFERLRPFAAEARPHRGWIRAIRNALGMSTAELGARLGVSQQSITALEQSEARETIRLDSLRRAATALDCDLMYALVPRRPLEDMVGEQARHKAAQHLRRVAHHSRLEDQEVLEEDAAAQLADLAAELVDRRGLWSDGQHVT